MKYIFVIVLMLLCTLLQTGKAVAQTDENFQFVEINHGTAPASNGTNGALPGKPSGSSRVLQVFHITKTTDSVELKINANFGVEYIIRAKDTTLAGVIVEWIYPKTIRDDEGTKLKTIRYTTNRLTNTPLIALYSIEQAYEMVKGKWQINILLKDKILYTKTFILY